MTCYAVFSHLLSEQVGTALDRLNFLIDNGHVTQVLRTDVSALGVILNPREWEPHLSLMKALGTDLAL